MGKLKIKIRNSPILYDLNFSTKLNRILIFSYSFSFNLLGTEFRDRFQLFTYFEIPPQHPYSLIFSTLPKIFNF